MPFGCFASLFFGSGVVGRESPQFDSKRGSIEILERPTHRIVHRVPSPVDLRPNAYAMDPARNANVFERSVFDLVLMDNHRFSFGFVQPIGLPKLGVLRLALVDRS
jgi:hypothetical protein